MKNLTFIGLVEREMRWTWTIPTGQRRPRKDEAITWLTKTCMQGNLKAKLEMIQSNVLSILMYIIAQLLRTLSYYFFSEGTKHRPTICLYGPYVFDSTVGTTCGFKSRFHVILQQKYWWHDCRMAFSVCLLRVSKWAVISVMRLVVQ